MSALGPVVAAQNVAAAQAQELDLAAVDATFAELAATLRHPEFAQVVHHYLERLDPDGPEPDPTEHRSLVLAKHADGTLTGRFRLDAVGGGEAAGSSRGAPEGRPPRRR